MDCYQNPKTPRYHFTETSQANRFPQSILARMKRWENETVGDVITSTSGNDPDWKVPNKVTGVKRTTSYSHGRILYCECGISEYTVNATVTIKTKGGYNRTHVHRAGLPFLTVGVYNYECNATKSYQAVVKNMTRFINRGLQHMDDVIITGSRVTRTQHATNLEKGRRSNIHRYPPSTMRRKEPWKASTRRTKIHVTIGESAPK